MSVNLIETSLSRGPWESRSVRGYQRLYSFLLMEPRQRSRGEPLRFWPTLRKPLRIDPFWTIFEGSHGCVLSSICYTARQVFMSSREISQRTDRVIVTPAGRREAILQFMRSAERELCLSLFRCDDLTIIDEVAAA